MFIGMQMWIQGLWRRGNGYNVVSYSVDPSTSPHEKGIVRQFHSGKGRMMHNSKKKYYLFYRVLMVLHYL